MLQFKPYGFIYNLDNGKGTYRDTLNHGDSHSGLNNPYNKGKRNGKET